jgi:hypothetical protein
MSSSDYIADSNAGFVRDLGYRSELRSVADSVEEDAAGENGAELMNNREARVKIAMGRLDDSLSRDSTVRIIAQSGLLRAWSRKR